MKYLVLFLKKINKKVFMNVVCCSRDWRFECINIQIRSESSLTISNTLSFCVGKMLESKSNEKDISPHMQLR